MNKLPINAVEYFYDSKTRKIIGEFDKEEDLLKISYDMFPIKFKPTLLVFDVPDNYDDNLLHSIKQQADKASVVSYVAFKINNDKCNLLAETLFKNYGFVNINFFCNCELKTPFLYINDEDGKELYKNMNELVGREIKWA